MQDAPLLRSALRLNAAFSFGTGLASLGFAETLTTGLALPRVAILLVGSNLVVYGIILFALSRARRPASPWTVVASVLDVAWVVGSVVFVAIRDVPSAELVLGTAGVVLACAVLQVLGLRRALFRDGHGSFALERRVNASAQRAWVVVSDVARYAEVAGTLHRSEIVSGEGLGLVRRCEDLNGACWTETCTRWEPGHAYAFDVDTSAPNYPLPLRTMRGDFEVDPGTARTSTVRIRFSFTPRGGFATELGLALVFALTGDRLVGAILRRWAVLMERTDAK